MSYEPTSPVHNCRIHFSRGSDVSVERVHPCHEGIIWSTDASRKLQLVTVFIPYKYRIDR